MDWIWFWYVLMLAFECFWSDLVGVGLLQILPSKSCAQPRRTTKKDGFSFQVTHPHQTVYAFGATPQVASGSRGMCNPSFKSKGSKMAGKGFWTVSDSVKGVSERIREDFGGSADLGFPGTNGAVHANSWAVGHGHEAHKHGWQGRSTNSQQDIGLYRKWPR